MKELIVRQAQPEDIDTMTELDGLCFAAPWSRESFRTEMEENPVAFYVVAEEDGTVVGYAGLWCIGDEGHITNVAVHPDHRDRHIGSALIKTIMEFTAEQGVSKYTLEVRPSNEGALTLYRNFGFREMGRRPGYYADNGEDALIMWCNTTDGRVPAEAGIGKVLQQ